jgi:MFS family permease
MTSLARRFVLANLIFWLTFVVTFVSESYSYTPHRPYFEGVFPTYFFFGRALRGIHSGTEVGLPPTLIALTFAKPSVLVSRSFYEPSRRRGITVDKQ